MRTREIITNIPYHSQLGWQIQKRLTELRLRRELGIQRDLINWMVYMAVKTDDIKYYRVLARLIEIEDEAKVSPMPDIDYQSIGRLRRFSQSRPVEIRVIRERDTYAPYLCPKCYAVDICDSCLYDLHLTESGVIRG